MRTKGAKKTRGGDETLWSLCVNTEISADEFRKRIALHDPNEWKTIVKVQGGDFFTPFHAACISQDDVGVFKAIFDHANDPHMLWKLKGKMEMTPLHFIAIYRLTDNSISAELLKFLLKDAKGSSYWTAKDEEGWTPLHYALDCCFGNKSRMTKTNFKICLENGAAKALFIAETHYGNYTPIVGVFAKKNIEWIEMTMKLGGARELMKMSDPMDVINKAYDVLQSTSLDWALLPKTQKEAFMNTIKKELVVHFLDKVSHLPNTQGYLEGTSVGLQDLPKHLVEDKIVPKIGGKKPHGAKRKKLVKT